MKIQAIFLIVLKKKKSGHINSFLKRGHFFERTGPAENLEEARHCLIRDKSQKWTQPYPNKSRET